MKTSGNTVLITGGATGIGLELARALAERGNETIICGRRAARLEEAKAAFPSLHTRVADVADPASREALVAWVTANFPRLNVLVNNAGVQHRIDLTDPAELGKAEEELAVNVMAPLYLTAMLLPHLERQPDAAVVNVSSGLAFAPLAGMATYCASKAAVHSMTMSLRHQLEGRNVRVFEMIPPLVKSELGAYHRPAEANRTAMPTEECVAAILDGLERNEYEVAIGGSAQMRTKREELFAAMNPH